MLLIPKKEVHETENLSAKERWNTKQTYIWAEVFFFLTCDQAFFVFFLRSGSIHTPHSQNASGLKVNDQLVAYATRVLAVRLKNYVWSHHRALKAKV